MLEAPVGHEAARRALEKELPDVALLLGPRSVGKMTLALYLANFYRVLPVDLKVIDPLNAERARELPKFTSTAAFGKFKLAVISLDKPPSFTDNAYEVSLNALLKVLEEPPPSVKFILTCSSKTLNTVISRSHVYRVGLLTNSELEKILTDKLGMSSSVAKASAALARGQVDVALGVEASEPMKNHVRSVLKAINEKDRQLFDQVSKNWAGVKERQTAEAVREYLLCWAREALTGQWVLFSDDETYGLAKDSSIPKRLISELYKLPGARANLSVRIAVEPLLVK